MLISSFLLVDNLAKIWRQLHTSSLGEENNLDPDDGNSWSCSACTLPIFSTPLIRTDAAGLLHAHCADLPAKLFRHELHPRAPLRRLTEDSSSSCDQCKRKCGSISYKCESCRFKLDVLCVGRTKILHRSHSHRLTVVTGSASFVCGSCGTQHEGLSALSYLCNACDFWIHPECASLPNAVILRQHPHTLLLAYHLSREKSGRLVRLRAHKCAICGGGVRRTGVYFCAECNYYAHLKCAMSQSFTPVLIRDAEFAGLIHFPPPNERASVMRHITENTASSSSSNSQVHEHPLIFHDQEEDDNGGGSGVCNACAQSISPPFYTCSHCPDFLLHTCCANLPNIIPNHFHHKGHSLSLSPKAKNSPSSGLFKCRVCELQRNGYSYSCRDCDNFTVDAVCAFLPRLSTHDSHGKTHILFMVNYDFSGTRTCVCCDGTVGSHQISYECSCCPHFTIHAPCAMRPSTVRHRFDEHPLMLTDCHDGRTICEICEERIDHVGWDYRCSECEQTFHWGCIRAPGIVFGGTIRVGRHGCPLSLIPQQTVRGYRCDYCLKKFTSRDNPTAYECSSCYFRMHHNCAQENVC